MRKMLIMVLLCYRSVALSMSAATQRPPAAAIASAHPLATQAGFEILAAGGNAFDAAIAVTAVLAVVEPYSSGIGGGGFWLLYRASDGKRVMIDGRERAPLKAHRNLYIGKDGKVVPGLSINGPLSAGIPGEPAALVHLAKRYGRLPLARSLAPAIRIAREGFRVDEYYRRMARFRLEALRRSPEAARILLMKGDVPPLGYLIRQPELANTLVALARHGHRGFYSGPVAKALVRAVQKAGGIWTLKDLAAYRVVERKPIVGTAVIGRYRADPGIEYPFGLPHRDPGPDLATAPGRRGHAPGLSRPGTIPWRPGFHQHPGQTPAVEDACKAVAQGYQQGPGDTEQQAAAGHGQ